MKRSDRSAVAQVDKAAQDEAVRDAAALAAARIVKATTSKTLDRSIAMAAR